MQDVIEQVAGWLEAGQAVALARVVDVERRAPRDPGSALAMTAAGTVAGSVSGGCVEPAVMEAAAEVLATGRPRLVRFGISDDEAFGVGLACGGTVHIFIEPLYPPGPQPGSTVPAPHSGHALARSLGAAIRAGQATALVTVLGPAGDAGGPAGDTGGPAGDTGGPVATSPPGTWLLIAEAATQPVQGSTGEARVDEQLAAAARADLARGVTARRRVAGLDLFIQSFAPPPVLYVIGAVHPAGALVSAGKFAGYRVVVVDPRSPFATSERLPGADAIERQWPDQYLAGQSLTARDAVCVLTHDLKFDVPAIQAALSTAVGYIGVMGSRRTHERRVAALLAAGVDAGALTRLKAPIGLDIGARTPQEMAIAILGEIIATRPRD